MWRLTFEELTRYERALKRALEERFAEEDRLILELVQRLYEEVANDEFTSASGGVGAPPGPFSYLIHILYPLDTLLQPFYAII
jgi:hypothetical protein